MKSPGGVIVYPTFIPQLPCAAITAYWYTSFRILLLALLERVYARLNGSDVIHRAVP